MEAAVRKIRRRLGRADRRGAKGGGRPGGFAARRGRERAGEGARGDEERRTEENSIAKRGEPPVGDQDGGTRLDESSGRRNDPA